MFPIGGHIFVFVVVVRALVVDVVVVEVVVVVVSCRGYVSAALVVDVMWLSRVGGRYIVIVVVVIALVVDVMVVETVVVMNGPYLLLGRYTAATCGPRVKNSVS